MKSKNLVILMGAGASTRFKTTKSKLLQDLAGSSMLSYFMESLAKLENIDIVVVVKHQKEAVIEEINKYYLKDNIEFVEQVNLDGTAGAVRDAINSVNKDYNRVLVLPADTPLIPANLMQEALANNSLSFVIGVESKLKTYGRFFMNDKKLVKILEPQSPDYPSSSDIINSSIYSFDYSFLKTNITAIQKNSKKGEFFLTDIIELASNKDSVSYKVLDNKDFYKVIGPNTLLALSDLNRLVYKKRIEEFLNNGVYFVDTNTVYIDKDVRIEKGVHIFPNVFLTGTTHIKKDVTIYEGSRIENSVIEENSVIKPYSLIYDSNIAEKNTIGPFTNIRFGTNTDTGVKIGAFAETKNAKIGEQSKIPHLSYVGDANLGKKVNIGCGVITCNYDGFKKHQTIIGDNVFVGSDSQLIAPVTLGDNAYVAAGTTVSKNVPEDAMAISRTPQTNKENFVKKFKARKQNA